MQKLTDELEERIERSNFTIKNIKDDINYYTQKLNDQIEILEHLKEMLKKLEA